MTYRTASTLPEPRRCPRDGHTLDEGAGGLAIATCARCFGAWLDAEAVVELVLSDDLQAALADEGERLRAHLGDGSAPLRCPCCGEPLARYQYGDGSHVTVDGCPAHGLWTDRHELPPLAVYLRHHAREVAPVLPGEAERLRRLALMGPGRSEDRDAELVPGFWRTLLAAARRPDLD